MRETEFHVSQNDEGHQNFRANLPISEPPHNFYAAADVAFVGGSLVKIGGHNLLEPAALQLPMITGPYTYNAEDIAELLFNGDALTIVHDEVTLAEAVTYLLGNPAERSRQGAVAAHLIEQNRGALARLLALLDPLLG